MVWCVPAVGKWKLEHVLAPIREKDEASKEYWERVIGYLRQSYNLPIDASIILK